MFVFLFDIDGTLIKTGGAGGEALLTAFSETFSVAEPQEVPFSGRTDRGIAQNLFRLHDVEDSLSNWELLRTEYLKRLPLFLPLRHGEVLPGVPQLLDHLAHLPDVALGLLTGNTREGARLKLEHFALEHYFAFGGYGDQHVERDAVAGEAISAFQAANMGGAEPKKVWVIGDTPLDIRCARAIDANVLAVATGWHERDRLEAAAPDLLLDDLQATDTIVQQLLDGTPSGL